MTLANLNSTMLAVRISLILLAMQFVLAAAAAQEQPSATLITIGPGDLSYERYGHNMLWIRDPGRKIDVVLNWGVFEFEQKNFTFNFIQGRLWYWMAMDATGPQRAIDFYRSLDRTIWLQKLNLSPAQVHELLDFCFTNLQDLSPPNRGYRYDYYQDNCSTRVRDALDHALDGQLKQQATTRPSEVTYRSETRRLMADIFPLYVSLNYVLGHPTDQKLSAWEEMFIPMRMRERLDQITISDGAGGRMSLVGRETLVHTSAHIIRRPGPPQWVGGFLLLGVIIGSALIWLVEPAQQDSRRARLMFGIFATCWSLFAGLAGAILSYLWLFTDHSAARYNENVLQLGPLSLALAVLAPLALRKARFLKLATIFAALVFVASATGLILKVLPIMYQANAEMIALALPAHAGLAWALWGLYSRQGSGIALERSTT